MQCSQNSNEAEMSLCYRTYNCSRNDQDQFIAMERLGHVNITLPKYTVT